MLTQRTADELRPFMKPRTVDKAKNSREAKTADDAMNKQLIQLRTVKKRTADCTENNP